MISKQKSLVIVFIWIMLLHMALPNVITTVLTFMKYLTNTKITETYFLPIK